MLDAFYDGLRERQRRMTTHSLERDPDQLSRIVDEHRVLADSIEAADVDGFATAVDAHMRRTHGLNDRGTR